MWLSYKFTKWKNAADCWGYSVYLAVIIKIDADTHYCTSTDLAVVVLVLVDLALVVLALDQAGMVDLAK